MVEKYTVAIIGCGRLGQHYAEVYQTLPNTELVAIAEYNPERRKIVGERFGISALYEDAADLFRHEKPDLSVIVLPGKFIKDAVIASAQAGVKGVSVDKPVEARLSDVDEMIAECEKRGIVFAGGNLQRAIGEVQEAARWLHAGDFGEIRGASVHGWGGEISGGGCQHIAVLRLFTGAEITEVIAWGAPQEALEKDDDEGLMINAQFKLSNGLICPIFSEATLTRGVDVWTDDALIRWDWGPPVIYQGFDDAGARIRINRPYTPLKYPRFSYLGTSILSFLDAVENGGELYVSGHDLRQSLEAAVAAKHSALRNNAPLSLPLADRSLALYPRAYRWLGGDQSGLVQTAQQALEDPLFPESA
jgi:predicted dehydrogenase